MKKAPPTPVKKHTSVAVKRELAAPEVREVAHTRRSGIRC